MTSGEACEQLLTGSASRNGTNVARGAALNTLPEAWLEARDFRGPSAILNTSGLFSLVLDTRVPSSGQALRSASTLASPVGSINICIRALGCFGCSVVGGGTALLREVSPRTFLRPNTGAEDDV